jgi:hypothetical protein|tara:strand:- start:137 stop:556 length:420 start_codon:yes stop_codon:yes gene_type:complete
MVKLIYENGHFFKRKKGKLVEVNKDGIPIVKTDTQLVVTKKIRTKDAINKKFGLSKQQPNFTGEVKGETSLAEEVLDVATTKEGIGTIGGAAVGGWFGSSMGIVALGTGIAGTLPVAIVGGVVGFLMVKAFGDDDKKKK